MCIECGFLMYKLLCAVFFFFGGGGVNAEMHESPVTLRNIAYIRLWLGVRHLCTFM